VGSCKRSEEMNSRARLAPTHASPSKDALEPIASAVDPKGKLPESKTYVVMPLAHISAAYE
jgi:hypothetical protein